LFTTYNKIMSDSYPPSASVSPGHSIPEQRHSPEAAEAQAGVSLPLGHAAMEGVGVRTQPVSLRVATAMQGVAGRKMIEIADLGSAVPFVRR
jgi:hypothetical protein